MDKIQGLECMNIFKPALVFLLAAGLSVSACDNVGGAGEDFVAIDLGDLEETLSAPAALDSGEVVIYQLAVLLDAGVNPVGFQSGMGRLGDHEQEGEGPCMLSGRRSLQTEVRDIESPLFAEDFTVARVDARNCKATSAQGIRTADGIAEFGCGIFDWCDTARYLNFGNGDQPYRNLLVTTTASSMTTRRVEAMGRADTATNRFRYQNLALTSSIESMAGDEIVEQLHAARWGDDETSLGWTNTPSGNNTIIEINGPFATATNRGLNEEGPDLCPGGSVAVETLTPITRASNGNLNAGLLRFTAGDYQATVAFASGAASAVTVQPAPSVDDEGVETPNPPVVYSRTNFNNMRTALLNTCKQVVQIHR